MLHLIVTSLRTYGFTVVQCRLPLHALQGVDMVHMVWAYGFTGLHSYPSLTLCTWSRSSAPPPTHPWVHQSAGLRVYTGTMLAPFTRGRHGLHGLGLQAYGGTLLYIPHAVRMVYVDCHPSPYTGLRFTFDMVCMVYTGNMTPHSCYTS